MSQLPNIITSPWLPILEDSSEGIAVAAPHPWRLIYVNPTLAKWLGVAPSDLLGRAIEDVFRAVGPHDLSARFESVRCGKESHASFSHELGLDCGSANPVEVRLHRILGDGGEQLVGIVVRRATFDAQQEAAVGAGRLDPLTGLADRSVLLARMTDLLRGGRAADQQFAVLFIDLDNFKQVNDAHGHLVGDRVLREVAWRLAGCVRTGDHIVRFGGDEFVALVERVSGWPEIQPVVDRIHAALAKPIALAEGEVTLSVSVGAAEASVEHRTPEDLLRDADRAMYASKRFQT